MVQTKIFDLFATLNIHIITTVKRNFSNMKIQRFVCNMFQENCYIVSDETGECVIIDCGAFFDEEKKAIADYVSDNNLTPKHLLCTHGHIDHNFGDKFILDTFGLHPEVCKADQPLMDRLGEQAKAFIGVDCGNDFPKVGKHIGNEEKITFGNHTFCIIGTPGHTPGSVFFYCKEEKLAFSGDTLFQMSIGRTDLELGNFDNIMQSLQHIAQTLPADTVILPGHGGRTTMKDEMANNPYLNTNW